MARCKYGKLKHPRGRRRCKLAPRGARSKRKTRRSRKATYVIGPLPADWPKYGPEAYRRRTTNWARGGSVDGYRRRRKR